MGPIADAERRELAAALLDEGERAASERRPASVTKRQLTAFGQAKLAFVRRLPELCLQHQARAFASVVDKEALRPEGSFPSEGLLLPV
jgi:hypothetical protein